MRARRHPSQGVLAQFAAGQIHPVPSVTVAAHLESCGECRSTVAAMEETEGRDLQSSDPVQMSRGSLEAALARVEGAPAEADPVTLDRQIGDVPLPAAAAEAGFGARRWLGSGLWAAPMLGPRDTPWRTFLLRVPAGTRIPRHGHTGSELIAVLVGAFDDDGHFSAGDFAENDPSVGHGLRVGESSHCACLISTQGPILWRGRGKVIGALLGI